MENRIFDDQTLTRAIDVAKQDNEDRLMIKFFIKEVKEDQRQDAEEPHSVGCRQLNPKKNDGAKPQMQNAQAAEIGIEEKKGDKDQPSAH